MTKRTTSTLTKILKQHHTPWIGAALDTLINALPILSAYTYVTLTILLHDTIKPYLVAWGVEWINIWVFFAIVSTIILLLMLGVYKFLLLPLWSFRAKQMFDHENQLLFMTKLNSMEEKLDKLEETINKKEHNNE